MIQDAKERSSGASLSALTYTRTRFAKIETVIGDLTAQLAELMKLRKNVEAQYEHPAGRLRLSR